MFFPNLICNNWNPPPHTFLKKIKIKIRGMWLISISFRRGEEGLFNLILTKKTPFPLSLDFYSKKWVGDGYVDTKQIRKTATFFTTIYILSIPITYSLVLYPLHLLVPENQICTTIHIQLLIPTRCALNKEKLVVE